MKENEIEEALQEIERQIVSLPKGYLTVKKIYGKPRHYLQWNEGKKKKSKYVSEDAFIKVQAEIKQRKELEREAKSLSALLPEGKRKGEKEESVTLSSNVLTGKRLEVFLLGEGEKKKRKALFAKLQDYLYGDYKGKVLILYGLRRSGKSTLIRQAISEMEEEDFFRTAFIQIYKGETLSSLFDQIKALQGLHYRYLFIDEVTLLDDFIEGAGFLADIFACSDMKIVLSGTDSLGFRFAYSSSLFDRAILLHTTFLPYHEFEEVLGIRGIDRYIEYGGTMCFGGDPYNRTPFFDDEDCLKNYVDSAIANNIQHSLECYQDGGHFRDLYDLYQKKELTNLTNRVVEDMNHRFALEALNEDFVSHDLGISARNLRNEEDEYFHVLDRIDKEKVTSRLKELLEIKNKEEREIPLEEAHRKEIGEYLSALDLIFPAELRSIHPSSKARYRTLFALPGLRYAQAKALVSSLRKDQVFASLPLKERNLVVEQTLSEIKGRMMEDIVLLETKLAFPKKEVFKLEFPFGEFDMVIFDEKKETCEIYEIKHSEMLAEEQYRHLVNEEMLSQTSFRYGEITKRAVIYRGGSKTLPNGIVYLNVEEYLKSLGE